MKLSPYAVKKKISDSGFGKSKAPVLGRLDMELTERCNNNCIHCCINLSADDADAKKRELSANEIKKILKEAESLGCMTVRYTGGEPLLRGDFEELYICARKLGLKVLLFTNATLITPYLADLFSRIPPLEKIEVTVYGMKSKSYEAVTGVAGSYEAAFRGMKLLLERKIPFIVKSAFLPPNKYEIGEFESWAANIPWMDKPPSYSIFFDLRRRRNDAKSLSIKKIRPLPEEGLKVLTRRREEYIKDMRMFCSKFIRPSGDKLFSCGSGIRGGCVDAYGYFQPCMGLGYPDAVYDLRKGSLKEALEKLFPKVREIKAHDSGYLSRCARCFLKGLCEQCPAKSWTEHGTLDTPVEYLCEAAHVQARFLGLINDKENAWDVADWKKRIEIFIKKGDGLYGNKN